MQYVDGDVDGVLHAARRNPQSSWTILPVLCRWMRYAEAIVLYLEQGQWQSAVDLFRCEAWPSLFGCLEVCAPW